MTTDLTLYTAAEVADVLRLNHQVVQRKLQSGEIPGYRIGKEWRVEKSQLLEWLEDHSNRRDHLTDPFFNRDGRLKAIPASHTKRDAVLKRLITEFDQNRTYKEAEVNATLRRFHDDVATLRREMVSAGLLVRTTRGIYKRTGPKDLILRRK